MKIGYCRVSTDKSEQDTSVDTQQEALTKAGCHKIFTERASAFKAGLKRKQWERCKELIKSGEVTHFMICSLSRGSRRQENTEMSLLCNEHNVEFIVLDGTNANVDTAEGMLMVGILDTVNRVDSKIKGIAVKRGNAARRAAGATAIGRVPFGYVYDGMKPVPHPQKFKLAKQLWKDLDEWEFRANKLLHNKPQWAEHFTQNGLLKWMKNPFLMGVARYDCPAYEPLVSPEEWDRCQRLLQERIWYRDHKGPTIKLLSQTLRCEKCGRFMNYNYTAGRARMKCMNPPCEWYGRGLAEWKVKAQVIATLRSSVQHLAEVAKQPKATTLKIATEEELAQRRRLEMLLAMQNEGQDGLEEAISNLRVALKVRRAPTGGQPPWGAWKKLILAPGALEAATDQELRAVFLDLIEELRYVGDPNTVVVTLRDGTQSDTH